MKTEKQAAAPAEPTPTKRKPYPSDVDDEEWTFVEPYLILMDQDAPQRKYELREVFNALRWITSV